MDNVERMDSGQIILHATGKNERSGQSISLLTEYDNPFKMRNWRSKYSLYTNDDLKKK